MPQHHVISMVSTILGHCSQPVDQHTRNNSVIVKISATDKQIWHRVELISLKELLVVILLVCDKCRPQIADWQLNKVNIVVNCSNRFPIPKFQVL